ncbi:MAG: hypothetical protein JST30_16435 [Armatimonadetes bacterium]|nr:hypothetical protein [Armatimonadota bacterium]
MRIGTVTCATLPEPDHDQPLLEAALARAGHEAVPVPWDAPADLDGLDLLLVRSCWNYYEQPNAFLAWTAQAASKVPMLNPAPVVAWNAHKGYLKDLEARGLSVVPTTFVEQGTESGLEVALGSFPGSGLVVKPAVSAGSYRTRVFDDPADPDAVPFLAGILADGDAMVQPFLPSVRTVGERSVVWFGGETSHVVVKKPRFDGDDESVRFGGSATDEERSLLEACLDGLDDVFYARLDLMESDGRWLVSELELIEPSLFFFKAEGTAGRFVEALERAV